MIREQHKKEEPRKEEPRKEEPREDPCDYCKHLHYNSDGSVSCDSSFERICLTNGIRMFKELI